MLNHIEINLLIRLLLAHFISDFALQTTWIIKHKKPLQKGMLLHIAITILTAGLLSQYWLAAIGIGAVHYIIDIAKQQLVKKYPKKLLSLFIADQLLHIIIIIVIWSILIGRIFIPVDVLKTALTQHQFTIICLGYIIAIWPIGYIVGFATQSLLKSTIQQVPQSNVEEWLDLQSAGRVIGIFERIIIVTFVLFDQYSAIGFLITGKSILRLNSKLQTEYVLVGTMLSYALSIGTGALMNYFLKM
jgi:hypothetical protein